MNLFSCHHSHLLRLFQVIVCPVQSAPPVTGRASFIALCLSVCLSVRLLHWSDNGDTVATL